MIKFRGHLTCALLAGAFLLLPAGPAYPLKEMASKSLPEMAVGKPVPDFRIEDLDGNPFHLAAVKDRKVILLVLWAVWCNPCVEEIPRLNELQDKYGARGLEILGVAVPYGQDEKSVRGFTKRNDMHYPLFFDGADQLSERLGAMFVPHNYLIAADGTLSYEGTALPGDIDTRIEALLRDLPEVSEAGGQGTEEGE